MHMKMNRPDSARPKSTRKFTILPKTAAASTASRPVTQQGLSGVRPAQSPLTTQTRIHKDKRYYLSLLQLHEREIREEISHLKKQSEEYKSLSSKQDEYKKQAEKLAKECNEKQETLNIFNMVLSTHLSRTNDEEILIETAAYRQKNEVLSQKIDEMISKKLTLNETVSKLENDIDQIEKIWEKEIEKLNEGDRLKYQTLARENDTYLQSLSDLKAKISNVTSKLKLIEESLFEAKKMKIKLLDEKQQFQEQIKTLERDINDAESPEEVQTKLLEQVKNDKADIETLGKVIENLERELKNKEEYLFEIDSEMDSKNKDRLKKLKDLRERGEDMKKFIDECDLSVPELQEKIVETNKKVETALEHSSISTIDLKTLSEDYDEAKFTGNEENLNEIYEALKQKYTKIIKIGNSYKSELENVKKTYDELKNEIGKYRDVDALRESLFSKKIQAEEKKLELEQTLKTTEEVLENSKRENEALKVQLSENKLYEEIKKTEQDIEECNDEIALIKTKIESVGGEAHYLTLLDEVNILINTINEKIIKDLSAKK